MATKTCTNDGAQLANLVACTLLKFAQFRRDSSGENWELFYLRDKESREVDFFVTVNGPIAPLISPIHALAYPTAAHAVAIGRATETPW